MNSKILVFGSINADLVFPLEKLPTKGETVLGINYSFHPGGKGANQAVAASRAGAEVTFIGCLGEDAFAEELLNSLNSSNVDTSLIKKVNSPTGCAAIGVDLSGENQIMVAAGANLNVAASQVPDSLLNSSTIVILQMEIRPSENWSLIKRAKDLGAVIILNIAPAAGVPLEILNLIDFLIVNEYEVLFLSKDLGILEERPVEAAKKIVELTNQTCILTLGQNGAFCVNSLGAFHVRALEIKPVDTTAAGDCFVGWLAARLASGDNLEKSMLWASVAAGKACLMPGAQTSLPSFDIVSESLKELQPEKTSI
jgi:ribokinase